LAQDVRVPWPLFRSRERLAPRMRGRTCSATRHQEATAPVCAWVVVIACTRLRGPLTATSNRPVDAGHEQDPARWLSWCCPSVSFMLPLPATTPARYVSPPMRNAHGYHSNTAATHTTPDPCAYTVAKHCTAASTAAAATSSTFSQLELRRKKTHTGRWYLDLAPLTAPPPLRAAFVGCMRGVC
jgi:hypothetical protein